MRRSGFGPGAAGCDPFVAAPLFFDLGAFVVFVSAALTAAFAAPAVREAATLASSIPRFEGRSAYLIEPARNRDSPACAHRLAADRPMTNDGSRVRNERLTAVAAHMGSLSEWIAWAFSPEHILLSVLFGVSALGAVIALGVLLVRVWRGTNDRLDNVAEPASALRTGWWLCPACGSLNRPNQHCYKGCATSAGPVLAPRSEERGSELNTL